MHTNFGLKTWGKGTTWNSTHRGNDNIKMGFKEIGLKDVN
jgi:hypothetical protein